MILVPPDGPLDARFIPIGEAPGPEEEKRGIPFVPTAPSGKILKEGALSGSVPRDKMRILNVSPYRVEWEDGPLHLMRIRDQVAALQAEIDRCTEARTLLLIGADAAEAVLGICGPQRDPDNPKKRLTPSIQDYHGSTFTRAEALALQAWARENGIPTVQGLPPKVHSVCVTLHPAFALHGNMPRFKLAIKMAIGRAALLSQSAVAPSRPGAEVFDLYATPEALTGWLGAWGPVDVTSDVETPRDNPKRILLCGVGIATEKILVFDWTAAHVEIMRRWFRMAGATVGHNFLYDLRAFAAYDVRPVKPRSIYDTIAACARLQPVDDEVRDFPWLSLTTCVARHRPGFYYWKEAERTCQQALYQASFPWCAPEDFDRLYNGVDVYQNSALWMVVKPLLQREGML
jgi:uracil-DNA glycosylase family 4